jgi:hypothetical protein
MKLWNDQSAYKTQSERARRIARERFGREAFIQRLLRVVPDLASPGSMGLHDAQKRPGGQTVANAVSHRQFRRVRQQTFSNRYFEDYIFVHRRHQVKTLQSVAQLATEIEILETQRRGRKKSLRD